MQPRPGPEAIRQALDRVLSSAGFSKNARLSQFLRFVVERHLEGREAELKESIVGVEVFGRLPGFDPKVDGIVRTEAIRLRARLEKYYSSEGKNDTLVIELPKGGYRPAFRERSLAPEAPSARSRPLRHGRIALAALFLSATIGSVWWWRPVSPMSLTIAVLPFENLSRHTNGDNVADSLTDQLINSLALVEGLTVPSRTSSFALRDRAVTAAQAGSQLRADYLVEGSIVQADDRVRLSVALIRVRDERRVWSGRFDRDLANIFTADDDIAREVVETLQLKVGPERRTDANPQAYALYLRARQVMASFPTQGRPIVEAALELYAQAIAKDASYALAYAGMADTYLAVERNVGVAPKLGPDLLTQAKSAAARALELDPLLSEAHSSLASVHAREYKWEAAERSFRRAIQLNPNNAIAHLELGSNVLLMQGRVDEGLDEVRDALRLDPLSPSVNTEYGRALFWARRYDAAVNQLRVAIALEPTRARAYGALARALLAQGRAAEALTVFEDAVRRGALLPGLANGDLACVAARAGRPEGIAMLERQLRNP
ncbi:MAG: tetratricopeptide repeat protein, partial [Vicinamibacterales bacterium]